MLIKSIDREISLVRKSDPKVKVVSLFVRKKIHWGPLTLNEIEREKTVCKTLFHDYRRSSWIDQWTFATAIAYVHCVQIITFVDRWRSRLKRNPTVWLKSMLLGLYLPHATSDGKVMFSVVFVCHFVHTGEGAGSHVTTNQTCSNLFTIYPTHLSARGWLAFDWKAFLLLLIWSDVAFTFWLCSV